MVSARVPRSPQFAAAALIAEGLILRLSAGTDVYLFFFGDIEPDGHAIAACVAAVAEWQVLRFPAGAAIVGAWFEGDADGHAGRIGAAH